jgi:uncharacterized protein (TIGR03083 family)
MISPDASAALYRTAREQVIAAAGDLDEDRLATVVPACPRWTVRDLLAHQAGVARDFVDGNLDGAPLEPWTAVQVEARRGRPIGDILDEWSEYGTRLEEIVRSGERRGRLLNNPYVDAGTHQADLHGAVGTGRPSRELWLAALDFCLGAHKGEEPGSLTLVTEDAGYHLGSGEPSVEAKVESYELFRAAFGRRSVTQIASWSWSADPSRWATELPRLPQTRSELSD